MWLPETLSSSWIVIAIVWLGLRTVNLFWFTNSPSCDKPFLLYVFWLIDFKAFHLLQLSQLQSDLLCQDFLTPDAVREILDSYHKKVLIWFCEALYKFRVRTWFRTMLQLCNLDISLLLWCGGVRDDDKDGFVIFKSPSWCLRIGRIQFGYYLPLLRMIQHISAPLVLFGCQVL